MELYVLDSKYQPDTIVENYNSLVWTERAFTNGDFTLVSYDVDTHATQIPEGSCLRFNNDPGNQIMIAENVKIENDEIAKRRTLTITGRTIETVLSRRIMGVISGGGHNSYPYSFDGTSAATIADIINTMLPAQGASDEPARKYSLFTCSIDASVPSTLATTQRLFGYDKDVYANIVALLSEDGLSLKSTAPELNAPNINLVVYKGLDRTSTQSVNEKILLSPNSGNVSEADYLISKSALKNIGYATYTFNGDTYRSASYDIQGNTPPVNPAVGIDRREVLVDCTDLSYITGDDPTSIFDTIKSRVVAELVKDAQSYFVSVAMAQKNSFVYNVDYALGDVITFIDDFDINTNLIVSEYIKIKDTSGFRGYPTLTA